MAKRPYFPWRLILTVPSGQVEKNFRSESAAYEAVTRQRELVASGHSLVTSIRVEQWDPSKDAWVLFEQLSPDPIA